MPYIDDDKLIYNIRELPEAFSITSGDLLVVEDTEGTKTIDFNNIIIGLDNTTFGTTITQNATDIVALSATNNNLTTDIATNTANILSLSANTVVVTNETELAAAALASEPHITLVGIIPLTSLIHVQFGTTVKVQHGSGFDCQNTKEMLHLDGDLEVVGNQQVFYNTIPYVRSGTFFDIDELGSVWGLFNGTRNASWWGPAAKGGTQTDTNAIQCALDSWPITAGNGIAANPGTIYLPMGDAYEVTATLRLNNARMRWIGDFGTQINFRIPDSDPTDCCIDMSDNPAYNNVWDTSIIRMRLSDRQAWVGGFANGSVASGRAMIKANLLEERSTLEDLHIPQYGKYGIWLTGGVGNGGIVRSCIISAGANAQPIGMRMTGINGIFRVEDVAVVNDNTHIAFWHDRSGGTSISITNCHVENAKIGYLIGPDPYDPATPVALNSNTAAGNPRSRHSRCTLVDCDANTNRMNTDGNHDLPIHITCAQASVHIQNFETGGNRYDWDGSGLISENTSMVILRDDYVTDDPNIPTINTHAGVHLHNYRRWPVIAPATSYIRKSDGTVGGTPAAYGNYRIYWVYDLVR